MSNRRILYVGGGREAQETLEKAKALGLEILYIQRRGQFKERLLRYVDHVVLTDYQNPEVVIPLARTLQTLFPFAAAVSLSEDALVPVAQICEALGLPGNSLETVQLLKEKPMMRRRLNAAGFSPVMAREGQTLADLSAFAQECGLPMIVKPADASGSLGVFRIDDVAQCRQVWQEIRELDLPRFLMEEYLEGPEVSVESFSFHGRHVILAVTDKLILPNHVEIGHSIPAQLDGATNDLLAGFVQRFLDLVGLQEGPAHTEVKLTPKGLRIVESHNRPGGDRINELVRIACGFDMKTAALGWPCGLVEPLEGSPGLRAGAAIRFLMPPPGVVREIAGADRARELEGVVELQVGVKDGDRVRPVKESYDRSGHVIARGRTVREAISRCEQVLQMVRIVTAGGWQDNGNAIEYKSGSR